MISLLCTGTYQEKQQDRLTLAKALKKLRNQEKQFENMLNQLDTIVTEKEFEVSCYLCFKLRKWYVQNQ